MDTDEDIHEDIHEDDIHEQHDSSQVLIVRDLIVQLKNQIDKLECSQSQLRQALEENPDDNDFKSAVSENEVIIIKKLLKINESEKLLLSIDPSYQIEVKYQEKYDNLMHSRDCDSNPNEFRDGIYL